MPEFLRFLLAALAAYLIGAFPTGVLATRLAGAPDVRYHGSKHTGGTNTMKLTNPIIGAAVVIIDGLKGFLAWGVAFILTLGSPWALPLAGALAVIGHCWPVYTRFHGGMGLATAGGMIFVLTPQTLAFMIPVWAAFYFLVFKKAYSPRAVILAMILGTVLNLLIWPPSPGIRWFLIAVVPILAIRHLPEWQRQL